MPASSAYITEFAGIFFGGNMERYKWNFVRTLIGVMFFAFGVAFLIVPVISLASWNEFKKDAVPVTAEITDINAYTRRSNRGKRRYREVIVEYIYNGENYSEKLDYYISGMKKGDELEILIDPDDPSKNRSEPYLFSGIMAIFAVVFGGIGGGFLVYEIKRSKYVKKLIAENKYIYANYSNEEQANVTVNNVRYNQSVFVYEDVSGRKMMFKSEPHHPSSQPYIHGDSIKVYVDMENDPNKYYVSREK